MAYINYSPWSDAAQFGQSFGQQLQQLLLRAPQVASQVESQGLENTLIPFRGQELQARTGLYNMQADHEAAQAAGQVQENRSLGAGELALPAIVGKLTAGQSLGPEDMQGLGYLVHKNPEQAAQFINQIISLNTGKLATNQPAALANSMGAGSQYLRGVNVPANTTHIGPDNVITQGPDKQFAPTVNGPNAFGLPPGNTLNALNDMLFDLQSGKQTTNGAPRFPLYQQVTNALNQVLQGAHAPTNGVPGQPTQRIRRYNPATGRIE